MKLYASAMSMIQIDSWVSGMDGDLSAHHCSPCQRLYHSIFHKSRTAAGHVYWWIPKELISTNTCWFIMPDLLLRLLASLLPFSALWFILVVFVTIENWIHRTRPGFTHAHPIITFITVKLNISYLDCRVRLQFYIASHHKLFFARYRVLRCVLSFTLSQYYPMSHFVGLNHLRQNVPMV